MGSNPCRKRTACVFERATFLTKMEIKRLAALCQHACLGTMVENFGHLHRPVVYSGDAGHRSVSHSGCTSPGPYVM